MPRTGPRRGMVAFKATDDEVAEYDRQALAEGFVIRNGEPNRSELIRLWLAYARQNIPQGWRPEADGEDG